VVKKKKTSSKPRANKSKPERRIVLYKPPEESFEEKFKKQERASTAEKEERIQQMCNLMLNGTPRVHIMRFCKEEWNCSEKSVERYITFANEELAEMWKPIRKAEAQKAVETLKMVANEARALGQPAAAVAAQKEINRIVGIGDETISAMDKMGNSIVFNIVRSGLENSEPLSIEEEIPLVVMEL
jgi:hypothetical protein